MNTLWTRSEIAAAAAIAAAALFLFFFDLGGLPYRDYDEATYAQVIYEGLEADRYLPLTLHGANFDKPPFYFASTIALAKLIGFNEAVARFPSVLLGLLSLFLLYALARELSLRRPAALAAAALLLLTPAFLEAARQVRLDVPVTFFLLLAVYAFVRGQRSPRFLLLFGPALALGFLAKSVVIVLALPALFLLCAGTGAWKRLRSPYFWLGIALGLCIFLPWALFEYFRDPKYFTDTYLLSHLIDRVTDELIGGGVTTRTYFRHLARFAEPWILVFFVVLISLAAALVRRRTEAFREDRLCLATSAVVLVLFGAFAVSKTKLFYYLVPLFPFLALALASFGDTVYTKARRDERLVLGFVGGLLFIVGAVSTVYVGFHVEDSMGVVAWSEEEARLGQALRELPKDRPVLAEEYLQWETINFYGDVRITSVPEKLPERYYLVRPSVGAEALQKISGEKKVEYSGRGLLLISVGSE